MKKLLVICLSLLMCVSAFAGCNNSNNNADVGDGGTHNTDQDPNPTPDPEPTPDPDPKPDPKPDPEPEPDPDWLDSATVQLKTNLSADGYVRDKIGDFSVYEGTQAYRTVSTAEELCLAVKDAVWHYKTVWNGEGQPVTQTPAEGYTEENFKGTVHVIEITQDIDLGYYKLSDEAKKSGVIGSNIRNVNPIKDAQGNDVPPYTMSSMAQEHGMSVLNIHNTNDLLIYSKNGAKITHATMNVMASSNVAFRNLEFDEVWQWEDSQSNLARKVGDYDSQKWAYFKINHCGYVWIDHCTFGKAADGLIDYANPAYSETQLMANTNRTPYGLLDERGVHISWCNFKAGSDDKDGYLYKMMEEIEQNYQANLNDPTVSCKYLYYKALRDAGCSFENILYGLAIPQKKAFLCGDSGDNASDYEFNRKIKISISNCYFKNIEDRIPKLRGGNGYFYNNVVDNFQYNSYRTQLIGYASAVQKLGGNSGEWKCALVSQCLLASNGASLKAENCVFRGVNSLLKNNDKVSDTDVERNKAYYQIVNCMYQSMESSGVVLGSSTSAYNPFPAQGALYTEGFSWHATNGEEPFKICAISTSLKYLENELNN